MNKITIISPTKYSQTVELSHSTKSNKHFILYSKTNSLRFKTKKTNNLYIPLQIASIIKT